MLPVVYFAAAGASLFGGIGSGWYFWERGKQTAAAKLRQEDLREIKELLTRELDLQDLRDEAERRGVDPEAVVRGYESLKQEQPDLGQLAEHLSRFLRELESGKDPDRNQLPPSE